MKVRKGKKSFLIGTVVLLLTFVAYRYLMHVHDMNYVRTQCPGGIVYPDGNFLMEMRLATGEKRKILELCSPSKGASAIDRKHYSLSLDGNILAYDEIGYRSDTKVPHTLCVFDRARNRQMLKRDLGDSDILGTALSEKGDKVAVAMMKYPAGLGSRPKTYLVVLDVSTGATLLEEKDAGGASWYPDGQKIVYGDRWGKPVIFDFSTKERRRASWKKLPNFSPDGKWIIFGDDVIYNCKSKRMDKLLISDRFTSVCDWSPDSKHFLYTVHGTEFLLPDVYIYDVISKKSYRLPIDGSELMEYPMAWVK